MDNGATIIQLIESLGHELAEFRAQAVARFDGIDERLDILSSRLDRQAGLIQSGSRMAVRQNDWNERVDKSLERMAKRLTKLESKGQPESHRPRKAARNELDHVAPHDTYEMLTAKRLSPPS